jgi:hypothetical protein
MVQRGNPIFSFVSFEGCKVEIFPKGVVKVNKVTIP